MRISVSNDWRCSLNGELVETAPSVAQLYEMIGPPSRVRDGDGKTRAPVGHRNNQIHIYENEGFCFLEHHYTRRLMACELFFRADLRGAAARNITKAFDGALEIGGHSLSSQTALQSFFRECPVKFTPTMLGWLRAEREGFSVIITLEGAKLPSGQRSERLELVEVSISWPHDPWGEPAA